MPYTLDCLLAPKVVQVDQWFEVKLQTNYEPQLEQKFLCKTSCMSRKLKGTWMCLAGDLRVPKLEDGAFSFKLKFSQKVQSGVAEGSVNRFVYYLPFDLVVDGVLEASTDVRLILD